MNDLTSSLLYFAHGKPSQSSHRREQPRRANDCVMHDAVASLTACLEHVGDGVILLDPDLRVIYKTGTARRLLETCKDNLRVLNSQLIFADTDQALHLQQFAKGVRTRSMATRCGGGNKDVFFIDRTPSKPLIVSAFALPPTQDTSGKQLLLVLRDLGYRCAPNWVCFADR